MSTRIKKAIDKGKDIGHSKHISFIRPKEGIDIKFKLSKSKHSDNNKELVAEAVANFLIKHPTIYSDGYRDTHSSLLCEHLQNVFVDSTWTKNTSQQPFDVYSIDMRVAVENKSQIVPYRKKTKDYSDKSKLVLNATLYSSEVKVKDVVPKKYQAGLSEEVLESFMDVILAVSDRDGDTNKLVRFSLVDGDYWNVDYDTFRGSDDLYNQMNEEETQRAMLELLHEKHPENVFLSRYLSGDLPGVKLDFRKLIFVDNPTTVK